MAYQSLYRRYRPRRFAEVRGQEHLVRALRNAVAEDRVGHAYLFSGPRGTGKTSTARILAKVLNCAHPTDGEPCCECESCLSIESGTSFDLHELDAASNRGIDEMRSLLDSAALGTPGRTKVYILDEVHMLTPQASAALLKTLEEPPAHVVFVLATTDPQKVLPTIRSRTQHFELGLLPAEDLADHVRYVAADAGLDVGDEQVDYVVRRGAGSARDTLSALDQVVAAGGVPDEHEALDTLLDGLAEHDARRVLLGVHEQLVAGREPRVLGEALLVVLRNAFLSSMGADLGHLSDTDQQAAADHAGRLGARTITRALETLGSALVDMRQAADPRIPLEVALIRITRPDTEAGVDALAERVDRLERALSSGTPPTVAPSAVVDDRPASSSAPAAEVTARPSDDTAPPADAPADSDGPALTRARPADGAREALARKGGSSADRESGGPRGSGGSGGRSALAAHRGGKRADAAPPQDAPGGPSDAPSAQATPSARAVPKEDGAVAVIEGGAPPSRDELTLAWGDSVLGDLSQPARARYRDGRFQEVQDGVAVFALPSEIHVTRAEDRRAEVEEALSARFGCRLRLRLVAGEPPSAEPAAGPDSTAADDPVEDIGPVEELPDAHDLEDTHLQRITDAFPGAEVLEEGQGGPTT